MSFNLSGLSAYTDQLSTELVTKAVLKPQTVQNLTIRGNLTAATTAINVLDNVIDVKNYACGFGAGQVGNNSTIFDQINIVVEQKMVKETLCSSQLLDYWLSSQMSASAYQESVPFEAAIADLKVRSINKYIEQTVWSGDGGSLDGLLYQTSVAAGAIDGTSVASDFASASTAFQAFWDLVDIYAAGNLAALQEDDLICYVSAATYSKLVQALQNKGNAIIQQYPSISNVSGSPENSFIWPGTNIKVLLSPGLVDPGSPVTPAVIIAPRKYMYFGTGILNDESKFKFYYDPSQDDVKFLSAFKMGTACYSSQVVSTIA